MPRIVALALAMVLAPTVARARSPVHQIRAADRPWRVELAFSLDGRWYVPTALTPGLRVGVAVSDRTISSAYGLEVRELDRIPLADRHGGFVRPDLRGYGRVLVRDRQLELYLGAAIGATAYGPPRTAWTFATAAVQAGASVGFGPRVRFEVGAELGGDQHERVWRLAARAGLVLRL